MALPTLRQRSPKDHRLSTWYSASTEERDIQKTRASTEDSVRSSVDTPVYMYVCTRRMYVVERLTQTARPASVIVTGKP